MYEWVKRETSKYQKLILFLYLVFHRYPDTNNDTDTLMKIHTDTDIDTNIRIYFHTDTDIRFSIIPIQILIFSKRSLPIPIPISKKSY